MQSGFQFSKAGYALRIFAPAAQIPNAEIVPALARPGLFGD
jgi:hypothetical protein